ncbi:unnamed protein product [Diamesa tonsa]
MCWNTYNNSIICIDLRGANQQDIQNPFIALHVNAKMLLTNLITHAFIIEKQPPQVLHTNTKFQSSVRLLFGNVLPFKPEVEENKVEVLFVNKQQAQEIQRTNTVSTSSCGIFEDNTKLMDYNSINKTMNAAFEDMILKKRPANHRSANDSVMNRKYALCFKLRISFNEGAISIAWKSSSTTVSHILPMNATDLAIRSLTDCIMDCKELTKFYPNVDKLEAIKNYISPPRVVPVGRNYVPRKIRAEI